MQGKDKPAIAAPVSPERRDASPKKVEDIAPEAKAAKDAGWLAALHGYFTQAGLSVAAVTAFVVANKEAFIGVGVVLGLVLVGSLILTRYQKRKTASIVRTVTAAVQEGDRFRSAN